MLTGGDRHVLHGATDGEAEARLVDRLDGAHRLEGRIDICALNARGAIGRSAAAAERDHPRDPDGHCHDDGPDRPSALAATSGMDPPMLP